MAAAGLLHPAGDRVRMQQRHFLDRRAGDNPATYLQVIAIVDETGGDRGIDLDQDLLGGYRCSGGWRRVCLNARRERGVRRADPVRRGGQRLGIRHHAGNIHRYRGVHINDGSCGRGLARGSNRSGCG